MTVKLNTWKNATRAKSRTTQNAIALALDPEMMLIGARTPSSPRV